MGDLSHAAGALAPLASPWAVNAALIILALSVGGAVLVGLGGALLARFRDLIKAGATPQQVASILDKKINGGLDRIEARLAALNDEVDRRHADNQRLFGNIQGRLDGLDRLNDMAGGRWSGVERRRS